MGALDFSGRQQLYYQLYNLLFQDIISGKYPVGCIIPAESELCTLCGGGAVLSGNQLFRAVLCTGSHGA